MRHATSSRRTRSTRSTAPRRPPSRPRHGDAGEEPPSLFSLASAAASARSAPTFLAVEPDPARIEPLLLRRAAGFLPAIAGAEVVGRRMCARPQSVDGRPFIGAVAEVDGLFVCAGHGPWGISTGPASAAMAARAVLDGTAPPPELAASAPHLICAVIVHIVHRRRHRDSTDRSGWIAAIAPT